MLGYKIKEIFYSLQGEGYYSGSPAVFCRFSGCNLWSGKEPGRAEASCVFCDTDFSGTDGENGGIYENERVLAQTIGTLWPKEKHYVKKFVVCTGGEPLLQLNKELVDALHKKDFYIAVETNGTIEAPKIDWLCVSPKAGANLAQKSGNELKLVYPQEHDDPQKYLDLDFQHFFLQPMDGPQHEENLRKTLEYVLDHPRWRLSLQMQKILRIK